MSVGALESKKSADPELEDALKAAQRRLEAAIPSRGARPSAVPDWGHAAAEVITVETEQSRGAAEHRQPLYLLYLAILE